MAIKKFWTARISIAMATYNGARLIAEQLDSFAAQTVLPDELVVNDDGSTDGTLEVVERFAGIAPFAVRIYRNPSRLGRSMNFCEAISNCIGDAIFISDQDDHWYETKIQRLMLAMDQGAKVVINDQILLGPKIVVGWSVLKSLRSKGLPDWAFVLGGCTAMSRQFAQLSLPLPSNIPFDSWIHMLSGKLAIRMLIEEPLQSNRRFGSSTKQSVFAKNNPTPLHRGVRHGLADSRSGWAKQIVALEACARRIEERRDLAEALAGTSKVMRALAQIRSELELYRHRLAILSLPRGKRLVPVVRTFRDGGYDHFGGWKSAAKDLVRR